MDFLLLESPLVKPEVLGDDLRDHDMPEGQKGRNEGKRKKERTEALMSLSAPLDGHSKRTSGSRKMFDLCVV